MFSKIPKDRQIPKEGSFFADFLRNMKTKTNSKSPHYLYNGEKLRGRKMKIKMSNDENDETRLSNVDVKCSLSSGTNI
jgi:hypothetical protein